MIIEKNIFSQRTFWSSKMFAVTLKSALMSLRNIIKQWERWGVKQRDRPELDPQERRGLH